MQASNPGACVFLLVGPGGHLLLITEQLYQNEKYDPELAFFTNQFPLSCFGRTGSFARQLTIAAKAMHLEATNRPPPFLA